MAHRPHILAALRRLLSPAYRRQRYVLMAVAFGSLAGGIVMRSHAATPVVTAEAEQGSVAGNARSCADSQASGSQAVAFGAASCPSGPHYTTPALPVEPGGNIVWYGGYYYMPVKSGTEPRIRMARARHLSDFAAIKDDAALQAQKVVWDGAGSPISGFINWPVALYRLQGKWYIYMDAARDNPPDFTDRLYVLEADSDDPMGSWTLKGRVGQDTWTIGFAPFEWAGRLYMVVSNREGHTAGTYHALAIAPMSNPWTTSGDWTALTDPTYDWEKWSIDGPDTAPINEVDQPIVHDGELHLIFSASHVNSPNYCAGLLTYDGSGSLLDRRNWTKQSTPILSRTDLVAGPGQTFTFTSPDGSRDYLGYAYWRTPSQQSPRPVAIEPITWDAAGHLIANPPPAPGTNFDEPPGS